MKYIYILAAIIIAVSCNDSKQNEDNSGIKKNQQDTLISQDQRISYALGVFQSQDINRIYANKRVAEKVDRTEILAGIEDVLKNNEIGYNEDSATAIAKSYLNVQQPSMNQKNEASYCIGLVEGWHLKDLFTRENLGQKVNLSYVFKGVKDALDKNIELKITKKQARKIIEPAMRHYQQKQSKNIKKQSTQFLQQNAKKEGVQTTESGLQYKVLKKGTGKNPKKKSKVTVHYTGKLINGKIFDTSEKKNGGKGEPISFQLNQVIQGWQEGLLLMKEGAEYKFFIPSDLGYGARGNSNIPGGAALVFNVKLIKVG